MYFKNGQNECFFLVEKSQSKMDDLFFLVEKSQSKMDDSGVPP
jgi:hypothetical protein